jgi:hypothetical protein
MTVGERFFREQSANWSGIRALPNRKFSCGYCSIIVSSVLGYKLGHGTDGSGATIGEIHICPNCGGHVFFIGNQQHPSPVLGRHVHSVPDNLSRLYEEARKASGQGCYTAAVLVCRKILMNIAVDRGAEKNGNFMSYVNFLSEQGFVPPNGKGWVDHIRKKGNEANHEIVLMEENDCSDLMTFVEMLLRFIYEFPNMIPQTPQVA